MPDSCLPCPIYSGSLPVTWEEILWSKRWVCKGEKWGVSLLIDINETSTGQQRHKIKRKSYIHANVDTNTLLKCNNKRKAELFFKR